MHPRSDTSMAYPRVYYAGTIKVLLYLLLIAYCTYFTTFMPQLLYCPLLIALFLNYSKKRPFTQLSAVYLIYLIYTICAAMVLWAFKYSFSFTKPLLLQGIAPVIVGFATFYGTVLINKDKRALLANFRIFVLIGIIVTIIYFLVLLGAPLLESFLKIQSKEFAGEVIQNRYLFPGLDLMLLSSSMSTILFILHGSNRKYGVMSILGCLAILLSLTRSLWLGLALSILCFCVFNTNYKKLIVTTLIIAVVFIPIHALLLSTSYYRDIVNRVLESQEEGLDVSDARSSSLAYRFSGYSSGFEKFLESPIIGIGYSMPFREYIRSMDQESPMTELDVELSRTYIENSYINVLVYQGVVGISILFYLIYVFFSRLKYCSRIADKEVRSIYKALIFGFISIAAGSALSGLEYSSAQGTIVIGITFGFVESIYRLYVVSNGGAAIKETT